MTTELVRLQNIGVSFGDLTVHRDISFSLTEGESITLLGPSGIGKTLILKMVIGLLRPTKGVLSLLGTEIQGLSESALRPLRKNVGMLFQGAALFDSLNVFENVAYALREEGDYEEDVIHDIVHEKLRWIGLPDINKKFPSELSGGQKKRVGLARALVTQPRIMLFDEPTTGLDPTAIRLIDDLIVRLNQDLGTTCISVTHDIASAKRISQRWLLVNQGTIVADGPVEEVLHHSDCVNDFISGNWQDEMVCG